MLLAALTAAEAVSKSYRKAAEAGDARAQFMLGSHYWVKDKYEQAVYWFTKAAEQGDKSAQFYLDMSYEFDDGVAKDYLKAAQWYIKATEQGDSVVKKALEELTDKLDAASLYNIGLRYYNVDGVKEDDAAAEKWFTYVGGKRICSSAIYDGEHLTW